jgi:acetyl esterase/lipase
VLLAVPGGGWRRGDRSALRHWGQWLAERGIAVFAIDHRRSTEGKCFPQNVQDVAAALVFLEGHAHAWELDPARMGLLGASAGAHLGALAMLAAERPFIAQAIPKLPQVRIFIGVYGAYDLFDLWQADLVHNSAPSDQLTARMLGATPFDDPQLYFDASPIKHITYRNSGVKVLLIWGEQDQDVPPQQSRSFATALRQARFFVRTIPVADAGHHWFSEDPLDDAHGFTAPIAPRLLRFIQQHLAGG